MSFLPRLQRQCYTAIRKILHSSIVQDQISHLRHHQWKKQMRQLACRIVCVYHASTQTSIVKCNYKLYVKPNNDNNLAMCCLGYKDSFYKIGHFHICIVVHQANYRQRITLRNNETILLNVERSFPSR